MLVERGQDAGGRLAERVPAREEGGGALRIQVNAVNDYTDASVSVTATVIVPEGWSADPSDIAFNLPPIGHQVTDVRIERPRTDASGQVKLRYEFGGQAFQDVLEIGKSYDLQMTAENTGNAIKIVVTNPHEETVEGEVSIVTPLETWSPDLVGSSALAGISPRTQGVSLAPGESRTLVYRVTRAPDPAARWAHVEAGRGDDFPDSYWAVAKLMSNGRITLKRCDHTPPRRVQYDRPWLESYRVRAEQYGRTKKR